MTTRPMSHAASQSGGRRVPIRVGRSDRARVRDRSYRCARRTRHRGCIRAAVGRCQVAGGACVNVALTSHAKLTPPPPPLLSHPVGHTWMKYPPAPAIVRSGLIWTPSAIALLVCSLSARYTARSSATSPDEISTVPVYGTGDSGCVRTTASVPAGVRGWPSHYIRASTHGAAGPRSSGHPWRIRLV